MSGRNSGQALIEYLFIFALFSAISLGIAKGVGSFSVNIFQSFAYALTQELSTGHCNGSSCWHSAYENGVE